ncbi:uncharacterized protein LAESUDRAFT_721277 [Laetiporus sulphureus 93-53]|uniref:Uncharacterized protein n=1 Tax=Laetiporus sulphureus 93-53 TaxID=1314785 RepID=A0A165GVT0_9APHY|nr:uncharacterized protein LAESUDRAFT_721277 [Laetiporus sulphureus 93-53]KZT10890.1 hypothetical protein LAESUDRAFT_721277 [Laetiporus sulphureus 93-53]
MPLFHSSTQEREEPTPAPTQTQEPSRSRSIFSRRSDPSDYGQSASSSTHANSSRSGGSFFRRHRSSSLDCTHDDPKNDPSIVFARQKVTEAEAAEREADRALMQARAAVQSAKEHVRNLEREISEDAKRAKAKQSEAKNVSKSAKALGRHG